ncbi:MAG TPA: hypothetical protein VJ464_23800 [Blastocatellia bacterium]|nr:hypothetical protein [Blastocatellia bacterium]
MNKIYLVIVDTTQIQPYVFGSNRLRENVGASHLVAQATGEWALQTVNSVATANNINNIQTGTLDNDKWIERNGLDAEILYAGGGNTVVLFRDETGATNFIKKLSRKALTDAPNLQLVIECLPLDWENGSLVTKIDEGFKELARQKRSRSASAPLLGLGVSMMCQSTGLPVAGIAQPIPTDPTSFYPASAEILAKLRATDKANKRLEEMFADVLTNSYEFPRELDELGRTSGDYSYIAVVHADGDGMGKRIQQIGSNYRQADANGSYSQQNRNYITALRKFSVAVEKSAKKALIGALTTLKLSINTQGEITHSNPSVAECDSGPAPIKLRLGNYKYTLPVRPIVFGGDDLTFICDGRIGLTLALEYVKKFAQETGQNTDCGRLTACAGVAMVKSHYPFARAYSLAENLCRSAKQYRREIADDWDGACIDWHFALSGLAGDIKEIREREYMVQGNRLFLRPVTLEANPTNENFRSWNVVREAIKSFQGEEWSTKRNKVKALRDALREGDEAVQHFRTMFSLANLPDLGSDELNDFRDKGWRGWSNTGGGICGYFDAIEAMDWFMLLEGGEADENGDTPEAHQ